MSFERNVIYHGHVLEVLRTFPEKVLSCVVTSPPYWVQRVYHGLTPQIWGGTQNCDHEWHEFTRKSTRHSYQLTDEVCREFEWGWMQQPLGKIKSRGSKGWLRPVDREVVDTIEEAICIKCGAWKGDLGNEPFINMYVSHIAEIFDEVYRVLRDDGTLWLNLGDTYYGSGTGQSGGKQVYLLENEAWPQTINNTSGELQNKCMCDIPHRVAIELVNRGWIKRQTIVWHKPNALPESVKDRPTIDYEFLFMFTKSPQYYYEQQFEPVKYATIKRKRIPKVGGDKYTSLDAPYSMKYSGKDVVKYPQRNLRSVWSINVSRFPDAHFAVFPQDLIRRPILASCPKAICATCGQPRVPIFKKIDHSDPRRYTGKSSLITHGKGSESGNLRVDVWDIVCTGYTSCDCKNYVKGIVADIFMGSGNTALMARALGRDWIGIELSKEYVDMAYRRLNNERVS